MLAIGKKRAVVVGAGIAGITAAKQLSKHFETVTLIERDGFSGHSRQGHGAPQSPHLHQLLTAGIDALTTCFDDIESKIIEGGGVRTSQGKDARIERFPVIPFPQRELGIRSFTLSRHRLESILFRETANTANIEVLDNTKVLDLEANADRTGVCGLMFSQAGTHDGLECDLVVDASGRGDLTLSVLDRLGYARPPQDDIFMDIFYSTLCFYVPNGFSADWKSVVTQPRIPESTHGAILLTIEDNQWIVSLGSMDAKQHPENVTEFREFLAGLATTTIHDAIQNAEPIGKVQRFKYRQSWRRKFHELDRFPSGLVPLGDAICRTNPIQGQGMAAAMVSAGVLGETLAGDGTIQGYFKRLTEVHDATWSSSANIDFLFPTTTGAKPPDHAQTSQHLRALWFLSIQDEKIHKLLLEVTNLLRPMADLFTQEMRDRADAVIRDWSDRS